MHIHVLQAVVAVVLSANAACTCEVQLGPGASERAPQQHTPELTVTQQASAINPSPPPPPPPPAAAAIAAPLAPEPDPTGVLSEASVRKTAARHRNEVLFCMEQEATSQPPSLRVQFLVKPDGSVDNKIDVIERSEMPDRLASCLVSALKRWNFEKPMGGAARATLLLKK
jgi:hypothetical protein